MQWDLIKSHCGTDGALSLKPKNTEMSEFISVFFAFRDFCLFAIVVFSKFLWFFPSKERTEKKNLISDVLSRCQTDKFEFIGEFDVVYLIGERGDPHQVLPPICGGRTI